MFVSSLFVFLFICLFLSFSLSLSLSLISLFSILYHRPETVPSLESLQSLQGPLYSLELVGDVLRHRELALQGSLHQRRHIRPRLPSSKSRAAPPAARHQLERAGCNLLTRASHTDHTRDPPASVSAFQSGPHHLHVTGAVESVVTPPLGHLDNLLLHGDVFFVCGVENVRGSPLLCECELGGVQVDSDDLAGSCHLGCLDHCEADCSDAEHRDCGPWMDLNGIPDSSEAGADSTPEQTRFLERVGRVDLRTRDLSQYRILGERTRAHEMKNLRTVLQREPHSPVRHHSLALSSTDGGAKVRLRRAAENASRLVALRRVARHNVISRLHREHALPDRFDDCASLVTEN
mmetsp:Transcript_14356/g.28863  ORF Transcript_14356/g.28863 Transcript_14356/m.28863 type:complete len:348 (+) Transcript_14356:1328-2371(+)